MGASAGQIRRLTGSLNGLQMWAVDGTWERVSTAWWSRPTPEEDLARAWAASVDSAIVRAHQHAAAARTKGAPADERDDHAIS